MIYDVIIVGGGPTGINCAIKCKEEGLSYIILEKGVLVNSLYHFPMNMTFFSTSKKLEIAGIPFISHTEKPTRQEALEYYRRVVESKDINIQYRTAVQDIHKDKNQFHVVCQDKSLTCDNVIIATGFYDTPNYMDVAGENLPKVKHYYDDAHLYVGTDVLVVGAANSACDVALECWHKGARVTMAIRGSSIYERVKYWIKPNIENRISEGSIMAYFSTEVKEIKEHSVILSTPEGEEEIKNDFVLAMTGYSPDYTFLSKIGLDVEASGHRIPVHNPHTMESSISGIFLAGVLLGGLKTNTYFIENTFEHAERIVKEIVLRLSIA